MKFAAKVLRVEEQTTRRHLTGSGDTAKFSEVKTGWVITLQVGESTVSFLTPDKPDLVPGKCFMRIIQ